MRMVLMQNSIKIANKLNCIEEEVEHILNNNGLTAEDC